MSNLPSWKETTWTSPEVPGSIAWRTAVDIAGNVLYGISNGLKSSFPTDRMSRLPEAIDTVSDVANANVSQTEREQMGDSDSSSASQPSKDDLTKFWYESEQFFETISCGILPLIFFF